MFLLFSLLGLGAALAAYLRSTPSHESTAKLLVRHIMELSAPATPESAVPATEVEILTSRGVAVEVTEEIGPDRLRPGATVEEAAAAIRQGLQVEVPKHSNVMTVRFRHGDPVVAVAVLEAVVEKYFEARPRIHRSESAMEVPGDRVDQARRQLRDVDAELQRIRSDPAASPGDIAPLEKRKATREEELRALEESLEKVRVDDVPDHRVPNVSVVQRPSAARPVFRRPGGLVAGLAASGPVVGLLFSVMIVARRRS